MEEGVAAYLKLYGPDARDSDVGSSCSEDDGDDGDDDDNESDAEGSDGAEADAE